MTVADALARLERELAAARIGSRRDAELLLEHALRISRADLYTASRHQLTAEQQRSVREVEERRLRGEPVQYILGAWGFRRLTLKVDRRALIPRPETEVLVERALTLLRDADAPRVLDVGVGSGAIALSIADEAPHARVTGIDSSRDALSLARENAHALGLDVELVEHDAAAGLPPGPWDLVVSNPPYVPAGEHEQLAPDVREWEPRAALVEDGHTEAITRAARDVLARAGWLVLETHADGAREVAVLLERHGYSDVVVTRDLAGRERVVEGRWQ